MLLGEGEVVGTLRSPNERAVYTSVRIIRRSTWCIFSLILILGEGFTWSSTAVALLTWIFDGSPVVSMRAAVLTVSPIRE
jgi:hypothetical protein